MTQDEQHTMKRQEQSVLNNLEKLLWKPIISNRNVEYLSFSKLVGGGNNKSNHVLIIMKLIIIKTGTRSALVANKSKLLDITREEFF